MSYQVLARKWRPQQFDDVIGQPAVTRTLANAIKSGRIAQSFVFAGPRGVGKTTTARILARALNCEKGPTAEPCGVCDACREIAEGRDIDVLEIDAATHTQVDNVREVIISGLSIMPVRNRYKIFIIDEVHQLSNHSFNALLKSIEEPPPHVIFMMATTEVSKIPETVLSRSQVFEFKTISSRQIADQLAEHRSGGEDRGGRFRAAAHGAGGRRQHARCAERVRSGHRICRTEGHGLTTSRRCWGWSAAISCSTSSPRWPTKPPARRSSCRDERWSSDTTFVPSCASCRVSCAISSCCPSIRRASPILKSPPRSERERVTALVSRFSREDLLRAFDILTKAEADVRVAAQPRYHLEMALLRWIHMRKLVPLTELLGGVGRQDLADVRKPQALRPVSAPPAQNVSSPPVPMERKAAPVVPPVARRPPPAPKLQPLWRLRSRWSRHRSPRLARERQDGTLSWERSGRRRCFSTTPSSRRRRRSSSVRIA